MRRYHHFGIPTDVARPGETDHAAYKACSITPNSPSPGVTVAFIVPNGAPVEFLQFDKRKR